MAKECHYTARWILLQIFSCCHHEGIGYLTRLRRIRFNRFPLRVLLGVAVICEQQSVSGM
jgi:hypothetical protein